MTAVEVASVIEMVREDLAQKAERLNAEHRIWVHLAVVESLRVEEDGARGEYAYHKRRVAAKSLVASTGADRDQTDAHPDAELWARL